MNRTYVGIEFRTPIHFKTPIQGKILFLLFTYLYIYVFTGGEGGKKKVRL